MKGFLRGLTVATLLLLPLLCRITPAIGGAPTEGVPTEPSGVLMVTSHGNICIELFLDVCPITAGNFKNLTKAGFYSNLTIHRVIPDFIIQGGDPNGDGTGGPGYTIPAEASALALHHERGVISMANVGGDPATAGSQFFICLNGSTVTGLDGNFAVFGRVVEGMDVVDAICDVPTDSNDRPLTPVVMTTVELHDVLPPRADAGSDLEGYVGNWIELKASDCSDDMGIVSYTWTFVYKGEDITLEGREKEFKFREPGTYDLTLTVEDAAGNTAIATVQVTVLKKDLSRHLYEWSVLLFLFATLAVLGAIAVMGRRKRAMGEGK